MHQQKLALTKLPRLSSMRLVAAPLLLLDRSMQPEWKTFLIDSGAEFDGERLVSFGNAEREQSIFLSGDILCDLSHYGLISAYGKDALRFLQSQFSSDVTEVSQTRSQLSSYCSPKGRMLSCFRVFLRGDTYYLRLPSAMLEPMLQHLHIFLLRAKVTLADASDALIKCGYSGPHAEWELEQALGMYPVNFNDCVQANGATAVRVPGPNPRFEIYGELAVMKKLWTVLNVRAAPVGASSWALLDILAGIPSILPTTSDHFVPQMTNLQVIGGVNFKKGCYPGQEVIARMHYLGTLKRRMYRAHLPTDEVPQAGDPIYALGKKDAKLSGTIIDAQLYPDGGVEALAVLRIDDAEHHPLRLGSPDGIILELRSLPYEFQ
jgi:tRNA-modifying protein YgfZ